MRAIAIAGLMFGCAPCCSPAADYFAEESSAPPRATDTQWALQQTSEPQKEVVCFRVDAELDAVLPTARDRLLDAAAAWNREIRFGDDCSVRFGYELVAKVSIGNGRYQYPYGRGLPHESLIVSTHWVQNGTLVDKSPDECVKGEALLLSVLVHELGHVFNIGHMPKGSGGAMEQGYGSCEVLVPSEVEIEAAATR